MEDEVNEADCWICLSPEDHFLKIIETRHKVGSDYSYQSTLVQRSFLNT